MNPSYDWGPVPPKLPRGAIAEVTEVLLPIHLWRAPVTKVVPQGLSTVEQFVIEAALDLGDITVTDVAEVTGLPPELAARITARVAAVGVLAPIPGTEAPPAGPVYQPVSPAAEQALAKAALHEFHRAHLTFMYLPRTDELLAFEGGEGGPGAPLVHRLASAYHAPMPAGVAGADSAEFLNARISAGTVLGLPDWVHAAEPDESRLPETCPAYRCRGHLKADQGAVLQLVDANKSRRTQQVGFAKVAVGLSGWLASLAGSLDGAFAGWGTPSLSPQRLTPDGGGWSFSLTDELARAVLDADLPLTRPLGLSIRDEEAVLSVGVRLMPADDGARATFALDRAVGVVLAVPLEQLHTAALAAAMAAAVTDYDVAPTTDEVRAELWHRRQFFRLYALRAADDFAYD
ncbi:hypothetical protein [Micromonospora sp. CPCC 206061]|uniref:hypothetical protein n=1 Tax=Micromonospora sp. CPCC 206061 TaxID=3122410 RepID=UPI002FEF70E5